MAWDGHELIAAGGSAYGARSFSRLVFAYDPAGDRWRRIAPLPFARSGAQPVWNGHQLFLVRGFAAPGRPAARTLCYDPRTNRWLVLPKDGLPARFDSAAAWIPSGLAVWHHPDRDLGPLAPGRSRVRPEGGVMTLRVAFAVSFAVVLLAALAARALACGDGGSMNEVATAAVKSALDDAFITAHPRLHLRSSDVTRVAGHTYYGTMGGSGYAVATFVVRGRVWQPTILASFSGRRWHVVRQTQGAVCARWVPLEIVQVWYLAPLRVTDCYAEPA